MPGRKQGTLLPGSLMWRIAQLEPGESFVQEPTPGVKNARAALEGIISNAKSRGALPKGFSVKVKTCYGFEENDKSIPLFKFFRITRNR